jgi:hypothetical protein
MPLPTLLVPGSLRLGTGETPAGETPVEYITSWLRRRMSEYGGHGAAMADRVLVVRAETGSGKSTALPVAIFRILRSEMTPPAARYRGAGVICTQPRVLTAIALANDVAAPHSPWNTDMILGLTVGYQTGPLSERPPAGLIYATSGVLTAQLRNSEDSEIMARYRFIIVDEAHERSLDSDMSLMLLRNYYQRNIGNERLPFLILTSATFEAARYAEYFGVSLGNVIDVKGRGYDIATHWPESGANNYPAEAAAVAAHIHETHPEDDWLRGDILIFMPGMVESKSVVLFLEARLQTYMAAEFKTHPPFTVLMINREVVVSQMGHYPLVFVHPSKLPRVAGAASARRIIVSTVVAETGLTIDTLRYVIDCGWSRTQEMYPPWNASGLITRPAPQSRIQQRKGRVGRLFAGDFYPLYTENVYGALDIQQSPDIISSGIAGVFLAVVREQQRQKLRMGRAPEFRVEDMALLDPPAAESYLVAASIAVALGFMSPRASLPDRWPPPSLTAPLADEAAAPLADEAAAPLAIARGFGLTTLGHVAAMMGYMEMEDARILLSGYLWGAAVSDLATIVAATGASVKDILDDRGRAPRGSSPADLPPGAAALRAALPPFLVTRVGGGMTGALPPTESEAFFFRTKLLLADDFIELVLVFDMFMRKLDGARGDSVAVSQWCKDLGLNFNGLIDLAQRRDAVLGEMVAAGLNPYKNAHRRMAVLSVNEFTDGVCRIKRCLYDGMRARILEWKGEHPSGPGYYSLQGLKVKTPDMFTDEHASRLAALGVLRAGAQLSAHPQWILTDKIRMALVPMSPGDNAQSLMYYASVNRVSVLDGYVDPDVGFTSPREFPDA